MLFRADMNITLLFFSSVLKPSTIVKDLRNSEFPIFSEVVISHPLQSAKIPGCPFCNVERCQPLDFCYVIKNNLKGTTSHEFCGSAKDLASMVRDRLANYLTDNACQPAVSDLDTAYCWCQNSSSRETVEDQMRRVRLWRYQELKWHADKEYNTAIGKLMLPSICLLFLLHFNY